MIKNFLPDKLVAKLETTATWLIPKILGRRKEPNVGGKARGKHGVVRFGSIIERGGSGKICTSKDNEELKEIIEDNKELWDLIGILFTTLCPEEAKIMSTIPEELRVFGKMFTAGYWNMEPLYNVHRDIRDWRWCVVIAFGGFKSGILDFPVLNVSVNLMRLDICFFWSKKLFHTVVDADQSRQTIVLTNHTAVVRRFNGAVDHKNYDI